MANAISDVTATISSIKTKTLRQFAGQFESWVAESVKNFSADLNQIKVDGNCLQSIVDEHSCVALTRLI